ncbi:MAG: hypothetical protein ABH877_03215 [bacterium]
MAFRDQLLADISAVFLNADEFGEALIIDGTTVTAVVDEDQTAPHTMGPPEIGDSVFTRRKRVFVAAGLLTRPVEGQQLTLGSGAAAEKWYVRHVSEAEGMLEIELERHET